MMETSPLEMIRVTSHLDFASFEALIGREVLALRVPMFFDSNLADDLAEWFCSHTSRENYQVFADGNFRDSQTDRVGPAFNSLSPLLVAGRSSDPDIRAVIESFAETSRVHSSALRLFCRPRLSPIEELRLLLDELWPW